MASNQLLNFPCHWVLAANISHYNQEQEFWLSEEEKLRLARFRRDDDKKRYTLAHGLKRYTLSQLLTIDAGNLAFGAGEKGKPFCEQRRDVHFNISHGGDWVLLGVSSLAEIGVDVEAWEREVSDSVLEYALTADQIAKVKASNHHQQQFMCYWTQKEAISKAVGLGISINLKSLHCSGELGQDQIQYDGEMMQVFSRELGENSIASVCSSANEIPAFYSLQSFNKLTVIAI